MDLDTVQPAIEHGECSLDDFIDIGRMGIRCGEARQRGKLVHQPANGFDRARNRFGAGADNLQRRRIGGLGAFEMTLNAFRGKGDGRKRILDLMRDAPRHLAPSGLFLSLQKIGQVFEHDHVSRPLILMPQSGDRDCHTQRRALQRHLHLAGRHPHAIGATKQRFQILQHLRQKYVRQASPAKHMLTLRIPLGVKHTQ